jgi:hypothetical protein
MGEAEGLGNPCAIIASPCGTGTIAASATQPRTTRQRTYGGERMAFPTRFPKVGHGSAHFNERTGMCSHQTPPWERVVTHVGGCQASKAPLRIPPFIPSWNLSCNPYAKTEWPWLAAEQVDELLDFYHAVHHFGQVAA